MADEEPIVVSGGSVTIDFSDTFQQGRAPQGQTQYVNAMGRLSRVLVNDEEVAKLSDKDTVTIMYELS